MDTQKASKTDQKLVISFEVKKGENIYTFSMPYQCPLGEAYDAAYEVLADLVQMSQRAFEKAKQVEAKAEAEESK